MKNLFTKSLRPLLTIVTLLLTLIISPSCSNDDDATAPSTTTSSGSTTGTTAGSTSGTTAGSTSSTTSTTTQSTTQNVSVMDNMFTPATMTVSVGTTVIWTNNGGVTHTVTSNSGLFDSGNLTPGKTFQFKFTSAGSYPYHCNIHSGMTGSITVQ
jgi:plastocyanin